MEKIALIDGDIIAYQIAFEKAPNTGESEGFSTANLEEEKTWEDVKGSLDTFMQTLRDETGTTFYHGFLSPSRKKGFRAFIKSDEVYKGNRDNLEPPKFLQEIRDYLVKEYNFIALTSIETDDALGILQTLYNKQEETVSTICTKDKDLKQIKGRNYNWVTGDLVNVSEEEATRLLWKQMLTGDSSDNIIGCGEKQNLIYKSGAKQGQAYRKRVGVGPKEADEILDSVASNQYDARVLVEYINRFGTFKGVQKYYTAFNLVYILRDLSEAEHFGETEDILIATPWNKEETLKEENEPIF